MGTTLPTVPAVRFHLSLNVSDLGRSVGFYQTLFGRPPAKRRDDYAKFELDDPPLVLSLEPHPRGQGGAAQPRRLPDARRGGAGRHAAAAGSRRAFGRSARKASSAATPGRPNSG